MVELIRQTALLAAKCERMARECEQWVEDYDRMREESERLTTGGRVRFRREYFGGGLGDDPRP